MILRVVYDGSKADGSSLNDQRPLYALRVSLVEAGVEKLLETYVARNDSVAPNAWKIAEPFNIGCPPGEFSLTYPEANSSREDLLSMGPFFIPVFGVPGHTGIGIHGGGSCKGWPGSQAEEQGWCPTLNCFRMQNDELREFVGLLKQASFPVSFTVIQEEQ